MATDPQPRGDRVLAKLLDDNEQIGRLIIPPGVQPFPSRGVVMHVGPDTDLNVGDVVMFFKSAGIELQLDDERFLLVRDKDVLLLVEPAFQAAHG